MERSVLHYYDGHKAKYLLTQEIVEVYMVPTHKPILNILTNTEEDGYEVKAVKYNGATDTIRIREGTRENCHRYLSGFYKVDFVPTAEGERWKNPQFVNPNDEGIDLNEQFLYPYFTSTVYSESSNGKVWKML